MSESKSADDQQDVDAVRAAGADVAGREGFLPAWEQHVAEVAKIHGAGGDGPVAARRMLHDWMRRDPELVAHFDALADDQKAALQRSLAEPGPPVGQRGLFTDLVAEIKAALSRHPSVTEADGKGVFYLSDQTFRNWGRTVKNKPFSTFVPKTKVGVQNIVKYAAASGKRVRVSGYRHTWESLYSADGDILISLLPLDVVEDLPAKEPAIDPRDELQGITFVRTITEGGKEKALYKIGAATTNEQFRRWAVANLTWTVPLNVIMVEITYGGSNAPICHGAGWKNPTLSDLVAAVELVNANGELQVVDDPALLASVSGCFGLLGVVTAITLKLDPMTYAKMTPEKTPVELTIPPPTGMALPPQISVSGIPQAALDAAWAEFVRRAETSYYAEWFWFPFQKNCWVNTWNNDGARADARDYPGPLDTALQEGESYLAQLANETVVKLLPGSVQAQLLATTAMAFLPADTTIVTPLIDALHFRRGIQNMRVLDMELEIPIPGRADDATKPDWTICQRAWWAAINAVYDEYNNHNKNAPMRIALEMRITAGSGVTMAPQHGNDLGTCSIEVLTNLDASPGEWLAFMQRITDAWTALTDSAGNALNIRPHWAKQWKGLTFGGRDVKDYLKNVAYRDQIPKFGADLAAAAAAGGVTMSQLQKLFSNPLLDELFGSIFTP